MTPVRAALQALVVSSCVFIFSNAFAGGNDNPLLLMVNFEEFEWRDTADGDALAWRGEVWLGKDRDKALLKTRGETTSDATEEFELQLLYSRAISRYWDLQLGWRGDFQPVEQRDWAVVGVQGLAPGFIETELAAFIGESGRASARARGAYEMLLTNRLMLEPELEINWFGKDDLANGVGSGISTLEAGLRLRYLIRRELAPYIGFAWEKAFGDTRRLIEAEGGKSSDLQVLAGLRFWF
jgi:copper resistance protein B